MRNSQKRIMPKHPAGAHKEHFTPAQLVLKASWEKDREAKRDWLKAENLKYDRAQTNAGVKFHQKFVRATGEEPTSQLIEAYGCSGSDWDSRLNEIERQRRTSEDDGIAAHVEAEVQRVIRIKGSSCRMLRQIYCEVAERLKVHADSFGAAIKRVESIHKTDRSKTIQKTVGVVGRMRIEVEAGLLVLDPETMHPMFPGRVYDVPNSPYWRSRLRDGDIRKVSV